MTALLRELLAKATPGEWRLHEWSPTQADICNDGVPIANGATEDARLIVAMHAALPALLDEVKRLRGAVKAANADVATVLTGLQLLADNCSELDAIPLGVGTTLGTVRDLIRQSARLLVHTANITRTPEPEHE